jgi:hypothetical protein
VQIWKFIARPNGSGSPACAKPLGRCATPADRVVWKNGLYERKKRLIEQNKKQTEDET